MAEPLTDAQVQLRAAQIDLEYFLGGASYALDHAVERIPPDKLHFRPTPQSMSACELVIHTYQSALIYAIAIRENGFKGADLDLIPIDSKKITDASQLLEFGAAVKRYVATAADGFTAADMQKTVKFDFGLELAGFDCVFTILEELLHHRGQLYLYLRLMGLTPPFAYDHGDN